MDTGEETISSSLDRKSIQRISFLRIFNALDIEHDQRFAQCPICKRKSLRFLQNANKVTCKPCFKRPATNIDFIMRVKQMSAADAQEWIGKIERFTGVRSTHSATATKEDVRILRNLAAQYENPYAHLLAHHSHKNKFRHESIAVVHFFLLHSIYAHGITNRVAGVVDKDLVEQAKDDIGLRFFTNSNYKEASKFIKTRFYTADIRKTQVITKHGALFCHDKNVLIPIYDNSILVGLISSDVLLDSKISASLIPFAHYPSEGATQAAILTQVKEALLCKYEGYDTWLEVLEDGTLPKIELPTIIDRRG